VPQVVSWLTVLGEATYDSERGRPPSRGGPPHHDVVHFQITPPCQLVSGRSPLSRLSREEGVGSVAGTDMGASDCCEKKMYTEVPGLTV